MRFRAILRAVKLERDHQIFGNSLSQMQDWAKEQVKIYGGRVEIYEITETLIDQYFPIKEQTEDSDPPRAP